MPVAVAVVAEKVDLKMWRRDPIEVQVYCYPVKEGNALTVPSKSRGS